MAEDDQTGSFEELIEFIKQSRGFDFTGYKRPSLRRRIEKRMQTVHVSSFEAYRSYLEQHQDEFVELFNTILINVTTFFRDEAVWEYLAEHVVPEIIEDAKDRDSIRIWSTGCASGEEAYSLAIVFAEQLLEEANRDRVKIYATDVDEEALTDGRHGVYPPSRLDNVSPERRQRFFEQIEQRFVVRPEIRRSVIFGRHDVVQDPPISRIDLICSRNTVMYFTSEAQNRILANFHFALRDKGVLFLGTSEMMLGRSNMFEPIDVKRRIFRKVAHAQAFRPLLRPPRPEEPRTELESLMHKVGFEAAPVAQLVVDRAGNLALANLQARAYFSLTPDDIGRPFKDLEVSFRPVELRSRIEQVYAERHVVSLRDVEWRSGDEVRYVDVQIAPLIATTGAMVGAGVTFTEVTRYRRLQHALEDSKRESETAYEELQSTVEELETTNEELQSTNEELETTNEELQSTNEELETMNEELQSTNEELETMNEELRRRSLELNDVNVFFESVLLSVRVAVIVTDLQLRVVVWNREAADMWGVREDEVHGQHLLNVDIGFPVDRLREPIRACLSGESQRETLIAPAMNRRGRSIETQVICTPLSREDGVQGVVILMEPRDSRPEPSVSD
jgi:two-component system, chemotaxis family, CheB/CheR fusion protein